MRSFIAFVALCAALSINSAMADTAPNGVWIEADQAAKAFVFIIDDEPVAMLDKEGLHVVEGINYGRSLTDKGPDDVRREIAERLKEVSDE